MVGRALSYAERSASAPVSGSGPRAQVAAPRAHGRRLALVRAATEPVSPKSQGVRHARTGHNRPYEALLALIDTSLDHTPPYAVAHAAANWAALLDDLAAHVARRSRAGLAEREYARMDDE